MSVVLLLAACTPSGDMTAPETTVKLFQAPSTSTPGAPSSADENAAPIDGSSPMIFSIESEPAVVGVGSVASLAVSSGFSGDVRFLSSDGSEITGMIEDGRGEIPIPENAVTGEYLVVAQGEDGALGVGAVFVADGPSLWLRSGQSSVGPADDVVVQIDAHDFPDDSVVLLAWGDIDLAGFVAEDAEFDAEPLGFLVPSADGSLQPGYAPVRLSEVIGQPLTMSGLQVAGLQALVIDAETEGVLYSNFLALTGCAEPSHITGTIGGSGAVRFLSTGDGLRSAGLMTGDGTFATDAPNGLLAVSAVRDDGLPTQPVFVDVPCGAGVTLDLVQGESAIAEPDVPTGDDHDVYEGDGGSLALSGHIEAEFLVEPICTFDGSEIKVAFATYDSDVPAILLYIDGGETSGDYSGRLKMTDWSAGGAQSEGTAGISITYAAGALLAEGVFGLTASYGDAAGEGSVTGTFTCTVLGLEAPGESEPPVAPNDEEFDLFAVAPVTTFDTLGPGLDVTAPACRSLLIDDRDDPSLGTLVATVLRKELPRAAVVTRGEVDWLLEAVHGGQIGQVRASEIASAVTEASPDLVIVPNLEDGKVVVDIRSVRQDQQPWSLEAPIADLAAAIAEGILCVDADDVWSVPGETVQMTVLVTDLLGNSVDGALVEIGGGGETIDVEPSSGMTAGGSFKTSVGMTEAGTGSLAVEAGGDGWRPTSVMTRIHSAAGYYLSGEHRIVLNPDDDLPIAPGPMSVTLVARSCLGISGPWRGVMFIEAGPYLSLTQTALALDFALGASSLEPGVNFFSVFAGGDGVPPSVDGEFGFLSSLEADALIQSLDPTATIPVPVSFVIPTPGSYVDLQIAGYYGTGFEARYNKARANLQLSVNDLTLLSAPISPLDGCDPFELENDFNAFRDNYDELFGSEE